MRQGRALQPGREPDPRRDAAAAEEAGRAAGGLRLDGGGERGKAGKRGAPHPRRPVSESGREPLEVSPGVAAVSLWGTQRPQGRQQ